MLSAAFETPIPAGEGFACVVSDAGESLWRELERSKITGPPGWGFDVPLATALYKNLPAENTQR